MRSPVYTHIWNVFWRDEIRTVVVYDIHGNYQYGIEELFL
jgi:hypothetical protein